MAPLIERWFYKIAPIARKSLWKAARGTLARFGSTARRAIDQPLYTMLSELVGHDDGALLRSFAMIMWRGMKRDAAASRASLFPVLFTDVILGTKLQSTNSARRIAGVLDMAVTTGSYPAFACPFCKHPRFWLAICWPVLVETYSYVSRRK